MSSLPSYRDLRIWILAHQYSVKIYSATRSFPANEQFGITSQIRRAAASVAANIVEGKGRGTAKELTHYLNIARGSAMETCYFCQLAKDVGYPPSQKTAGVSPRMNAPTALGLCASGVRKATKDEK